MQFVLATVSKFKTNKISCSDLGAKVITNPTPKARRSVEIDHGLEVFVTFGSS